MVQRDEKQQTDHDGFEWSKISLDLYKFNEAHV